MTSLGFTGTQRLDGFELALRTYLESADMTTYLRKFDTYVTGACIGWDAFVGRYLRTKFPPPIAQHIVIVPANESKIERWWEEFDLGSVDVIYMDKDTDYRARNEAIVKRSDQLFYCAEYPEDHHRSRRSGTWMTKRIAQKHHIPIDGIVLNKEQS